MGVCLRHARQFVIILSVHCRSICSRLCLENATIIAVTMIVVISQHVAFAVQNLQDIPFHWCIVSAAIELLPLRFRIYLESAVHVYVKNSPQFAVPNHVVWGLYCALQTALHHCFGPKPSRLRPKTSNLKGLF